MMLSRSRYDYAHIAHRACILQTLHLIGLFFVLTTSHLSFFRFGVAFSPWSPALGAVRVLWDAPLSTIRSTTLEPAHEGIKVALSAPVEYSADHQVESCFSVVVLL